MPIANHFCRIHGPATDTENAGFSQIGSLLVLAHNCSHLALFVFLVQTPFAYMRFVYLGPMTGQQFR